jgi:hypothetical protein
MRIRSRARLTFAVAATGLTAAAVIGPRVWTDGAVAVAAAQASTATATVPYAPYPSTGTELYVYNAATANCSDGGPGSQSQPFCTIAAAASAVQPGQTVIVEPGTYAGATISVQGTPEAPITFNAIQGATVNGSTTTPAPVFTVAGARDVTLSGFSAFPSGAHQSFDVTGGSSGVTINGGYAGGSGAPAIEADGTSSGVTISRMAIQGPRGVQVDAGASGAVITGNTYIGAHGVTVTDAPGTDVTGNTIRSECTDGISIAGNSSGVTVENNIVLPDRTTACAANSAISVSAGSEAGSVVDYNLINPVAGSPLYEWGGTSYASLADFQAASGQGAHDIAANPGLGNETLGTFLLPHLNIFWYPLTASSPAIDSANPDAPGALPSDQFGNPRADDPNVANPGAGSYDRGAFELQGGAAGAPGIPFESAVSSGPLTATFTLSLRPAWTSNGPLPILELTFDDAPTVITRTTSVRHAYTIAGQHTMRFFESIGYNGGVSASAQVVVGANYTPVAPARILDTRTGAGTGGTIAPVAANGTLTLPIPSVNGVPAADISAVVMNVTVTKPAKGGNLTVYPGTGAAPLVSNLNFSAGETVPNLVTVQLSGGEVSFRNNSGGTVQLVADLEGFYGPGGFGFKPAAPARVLDTRTGAGAGGAIAPVAANGNLQLDLSGRVPAGTAAVVMNVTVTQPQRDGFLTVYPGGLSKPNASNLNFTHGETVPNLVIVPVTGGVVNFANTSGGTVQLVADLAGYFASGAPDSFVPYGPTRELDTRTIHSPLAAHATDTINIVNYTVAGCACADAMVDNITVTAPAKAGVLTVYPAGQPRPLASNLNFSAGETVPNLVIVAGGNGKFSYYNNSPGPLQLIIDEYGYYIAAS